MCSIGDTRKTVGKKYEMVQKKRWNKVTVIENDERKLCWDFEYHLRKTMQ